MYFWLLEKQSSANFLNSVNLNLHIFYWYEKAYDLVE